MLYSGSTIRVESSGDWREQERLAKLGWGVLDTN